MKLKFSPIDFDSIDISRAGFVYFIHAEGTNRYKIGRSKNLITRICDIQRQSPYKLILVTSFYTLDCVADESFIHHKLKDYRVRGEWFEFTSNVDVFIDIQISCIHSNLSAQVRKKSLKIFSEIGVDTSNCLFAKNFHYFFNKIIEGADSPEEFYYFTAVINEITEKVDDQDLDSHNITSYVAGLLSGATDSVKIRREQ